MSKQSKIIYFFVTLIFFVIADIFLSDWILSFGYKLPENGIFDFINIQNNGAAFNIFEGSKIFLILFSVAALLMIITYVIKHISNISGIGTFFSSLLCAGIFTNMSERLLLGYVRDYIKINFIDFPVFNISDVFINLSVFAIVIIIIKNNYTKNNETDN